MKRIGKCFIIGIACSMVLVGCKDEVPKKEVKAVAVVPEKAIREAKGTVSVEESTSIYLDFPATIEEVRVKEGDKVQKGDVLFVLDTTEYENIMSQKINEKALYTMELAGLQKVAYPQNPHISQLTTQLSLKETELMQGTDGDIVMINSSIVLAKDQKEELLKDYKSAKELLAIGGISQKQVTDLEQAIRMKNKEIDDLEIKLQEANKLKQDEIDSIKTQVKDLEAQVSNTSTQTATSKDKLQLQIETVDLQIKSMEEKLEKPYLRGKEVIATEDNMLIYDLKVEKGTKTEGLMEPAFKSMTITNRVVIADVPEEYSDELKAGDKVRVIPYVDEEKVLEGTVVRLSEQAVEKYGEIIVKTIIQVEDKENILRIGSSVDIEF